MTLALWRETITAMATDALSFSRRGDHSVVAGVAGGFADQYGVDAFVVRGALVVLSFAGGLGIVLYALAYFLSREPVDNPGPTKPIDQRRNVSIGFITAGAVLIVRSTGVWLGDAFMVPLFVVISGVAVLGAVRPSADASPWGALPVSQLADVVGGRHARTRIAVGAALIALGLILVGTGSNVSSGLRVGVFATALTIIGVALLLGPWLARAAQEVAEERRQRIRSEEREAMAAHLHDSVLQTLALIQRTADDPRRTITLARSQERELRDWLYGSRGGRGASLAAAVRTMADEVEALYDLHIEVVVVGDQTMNDESLALTAALREACVNVAKHSGVEAASVFVEIGADAVEAFVRDRGRGFDRKEAPTDRHGIAQSIVARLERVGGRASISSSLGNGTEVHLTVPSAHRSEVTANAAQEVDS
jgi:signal transduction histidine kinase/phage shock protein PspC (stress-responsive transcriptional regulator)